ncbi:MAG: aromatic ring-hydroxylating dioxygenase subunit alpha [Pseudomonadales bacterium]|nr:aromatic ring-hydroxylating dioxygenase subunit alpha [Pseudomonadales bacterium]MCP5183705.1 aromatic ring-hydroxylating dioxygenase subunit alpha [Pseudomonadales bacterium]
MSRKIINHSDLAPAQCFDAGRYLSAHLLADEFDHIFANCWLLAGVARDLSRTGDYLVFTIGTQQILITRLQDGSLRAFHNTCQHRGMQLVADERGNARHFRCAYHAWTYAGDGSLKAVPHRDQFSAGLDADARGLAPVHVDTWNGLLFVHMGAQPPSLRSFLGAAAEQLAAYDFAAMQVVEDQTCHLNCNWKAVVDNFGELYHVDFLHPQHRRFVDCCNDEVHLFANGHTGVQVPGATVNPRFPIPREPTDLLAAQLQSVGLNPADYTNRIADIRAAVQQRKRALAQESGRDLGAFTDAQLTDAWQYNLFPNTVLSFGMDYLWILRPRPHATDPGRCEFDKITLERRDTAVPRPERDTFPYDAVVRGEKTMTITIDQDVELLSAVQTGMQSRGFRTTWLSDEELRVQHFHAQWERCMATR